MPRFDKAKVMVIGDIMLDRYWHGVTSRISPEAPVPVVKVTQNEERPGGAGNVALNIAALGAAAVLVGVTGKDEASDVLETALSSAGVLCDFHQISGKPTITKLRVISQHQQLIRLDFEEKLETNAHQTLKEKLEKQINSINALILSDYGKGSLQNPVELIELANANNIPVLVDPKGSDFSIYRGATLITPNLKEFELIVGASNSEEELVQKGLALIDELNIKALLVTRGENGMTLLRLGEPELHIPARAREVFDVTGAGDTVISTLASAIAVGEPLPQAAALANIAASLVVGKLGTATIAAPELRRAVQKEQGSERGVMTEQQLIIALKDARAHGEKIVMTNGCFDIIHAGHVGYLEEARKEGDRLIVAVNSDASVKRLKGEGRPLNSVERRMAVLAGLEAVDWVVSFEEDTPANVIESFKPEVLVKGGDYKIDTIVGKDFVNSYGGEVKVLSLLDNCSTTALVDKIKEQ